MQTAAAIGTIITSAGFFWWNVPSKDDTHLLRQETNRRFSEANAEMNRRFDQVNDRLGELRSDIEQLDQDYKNHLAKHNEKQ